MRRGSEVGILVVLRIIPRTSDFEMVSSWGFEQSEGLTFRSGLLRHFAKNRLKEWEAG